MCVIYACFKKIPPLAELEAGEACNSDGGGIAYYDLRGKVPVPTFQKGLTAKKIHKIAQGKPLPLLIHFRIASIGPAVPKLTHPFPITSGADLALSGTAPALLMHNGTWSEWSKVLHLVETFSGKKPPKGEWSDSRAMAWIAGNWSIGALLQVLGVNNFNKIALMTPEQVLFFPESSWHDEDGWVQSSYTWTKGKTGYQDLWKGVNTSITSKEPTEKLLLPAPLVRIVGVPNVEAAPAQTFTDKEVEDAWLEIRAQVEGCKVLDQCLTAN